jgi:hypothetical protein
MKTQGTQKTGTDQKSNFLKTWDHAKNDFYSWRGVAKTFKNADDETIANASSFIFSKFEKDFKIYAKEKQNKKGYLSLYFGYLFLCKKSKEYKGENEEVLNFVKMIKKQEFEKKIEKQNKKVAEK